jgi:putative DNA-invertase from lambdoid prophage Rac
MAKRSLQPPPRPEQRVYGYCRVSTERQADSGISLDEQQRKIEARCTENGWALEHVYVDAGSAFDALTTIEGFKRRKISLWLLDLGGDCSGNGISELIVTVLAATAQFERSLISERIKDAKRNLRRGNKHQGGKRPFGWQFGEANGHGRARELIPDEDEQAAIEDIVVMREVGRTLMDIRDTLRGRGFQISHQSVANIVARHALEAPA